MGAVTLVGREAERARLSAACSPDGDASARLLAVLGPAGVGKSALVAAVTEGLGASRITATAWEQELPLGLLGQLWPDVVTTRDPVVAASQLASDLAPGDPVVLVVEDAHWADAASLQALTTLVRHHRTTPIVVVAVGRDEGAAAGLRRTADEVVTLAPWTPVDVKAFAETRGLVLRPTVAAALARHTDGRPGLVVDLMTETPAATWADPDPPLGAPAGLVAEVGATLAAVRPEVRRLAEAVTVLAAVAGPAQVDLEETARLAGLDDPLPALDGARAAGLLAPGDLRHPAPATGALASAVLAVLGAERSAATHRRAAELVGDPDRRLGHLVAATPTRDATLADELDARARARAEEGAWAAVASLLRQASRLSEDPQLREERLTRAVDALVGAGDCIAAAAMIPAVESLRETPLRNAVLGYLAINRGRALEAETRLRRAWDIVNLEREPQVAASVCQRMVLHALAGCRGADQVAWADRAIELVGRDAPAGLEAAAIRGLGVAATGHRDRAREEYAVLAERVGHGAQAQRVTMGQGWLQLAMDEVEEARAAFERAVPTTYLGGSVRISVWSLAWLARVRFVTGDWDQALDAVAEGRRRLEESGIQLLGPLLQWTEVQVHALRGDWGPAAEALTVAESMGSEYPLMSVPCQLARAAVAEARADYADVVRALQPLAASRSGLDFEEPGVWPWADVLANALVIEGRHEEADALLATREPVARERGHASEQARLGYARGRLQGAQGHIDDACATFEASLRLLEGLPLRVDRARVSFAYGQTLRRAGRRRDADLVLTSARDLFASLGAATYVERCDRELKAGGLHQPRSTRGVAEMTPQEEEVASLVARGLSNREVASELFVSVKTVQYHLTRIYAKLGIRSRSELAARHRDHGE